jgi:hypothetical protein
MANGPPSADGRAARVARTGLALVHKGELILPAARSEATGEQALADSRAVVRYRFPVEVEVRAAAGEVDADAIADLALRRLTRALRGT